MSIDVESRGRTEEQTSLGYVPGKDRLYELTRVRGGLGVRPLSWLTGYVQFQDAHALGLPLRDTASNMRDAFDFRQGYVNFHYRLAQLFIGRQELRFGDERVVGISDWTNVSRTWDGADLRIGDRDRLDIFTTSVVGVSPTSLDTHGAGLTFHGVEANIRSLVPSTSLQPFILVRALPRVTSNQHVDGTETEFTPGIYFTSHLPLHFDASGTGTLQRGSYSNDSIHAGAGIIHAGYTMVRAPWHPHPEIEYDYATGNPQTNAYRISTYDQQYPSNHNAFGLTDLFGFRNITQTRINLSAHPNSRLRLLFQGGLLHVASKKDGVYSGSGSALFAAPVAGFSSDHIGSEFDASAKYSFSNSMTLQVGQGHFFPGTLMAQQKHGVPLTLAYFQLTWRSHVERSAGAR